MFDRLAIRNLSFRSRVQMRPKRFKLNVLFSVKAFEIHRQIKPIAVNTSNNPFFAFTRLDDFEILDCNQLVLWPISKRHWGDSSKNHTPLVCPWYGVLLRYPRCTATNAGLDYGLLFLIYDTALSKCNHLLIWLFLHNIAVTQPITRNVSTLTWCLQESKHSIDGMLLVHGTIRL